MDSMLVTYVNGKKVTIRNPDPEITLVRFLRDDLSCHGLAITTVEGIGDSHSQLHPVQERLAKSHGSQCGFCSPGFVVSMYTLLRNNPKPSSAEIEEALIGNLCRCTGYRPILEGFQTFSDSPCSLGADCCKNRGDNSTLVPTPSTSVPTPSTSVPTPSTSVPTPIAGNEERIDSTQYPIFPPELKVVDHHASEKCYSGQRVTWYSPVTLTKLMELRLKHPEAVYVCGNTATLVGTDAKNGYSRVVISLTHISEIQGMECTSGGVWCGAAVTVSQLELKLREIVSSINPHQTSLFSTLLSTMKGFACAQIKNAASVIGNLWLPSASDLLPIFISGGVTIRVLSPDGNTRDVRVSDSVSRDKSLSREDVVVGFTLPYSSQMEYYASYKQADRQHLAIATLNAGFRVQFSHPSNQVESMTLVFGGGMECIINCRLVTDYISGRPWNEETLDQVLSLVRVEMKSECNSGSESDVSYRSTLAEAFLHKFYHLIKQQLQADQDGDSLRSADVVCKCIQSKHDYDTSGASSHDGDCFKSIPGTSSSLHGTGEAVFVDDIPAQSNELQMALVYSSEAHADIISVDISDAVSCDGVRGYITHTDISGSNVWGPGELVFTDNTVHCVGQIIGAVVADTRIHAQIAAKLVHIEYKNKPAVFTIQEAIAEDSYIADTDSVLQRGNVDTALSDCDHVITSEMSVEGQEHFYMEPQACLCIPQENKEMEIFAATQIPNVLQSKVASTLNLPSTNINVRVKRLGGGFGGKQLRSLMVALPTAVAADKLGVPVRCVLDRDEDMCITGRRDPLVAKYSVGFSKSGTITALDVQLYSNGGHSADISGAVMKKAIVNFDSAYYVENLRVRGKVCRTNLPSNTACRGLAAPQAMLIMENIIKDVSSMLNMPPHMVQMNNFYKEDDLTMWGQALNDCNIQRCYNQVMDSADFITRLSSVNQFNGESKNVKRGICIMPTKYGVGMPFSFLNQAGALANIYADGHVLISHGGIDMGHGITTKLIQIASEDLGTPTNKIHIREMSTDKVPNSIITGASSTTSLNGAAVHNACIELNSRLEPIRKENPDLSWEELISAAFLRRISLSATGYYRTPDLTDLDWQTGRGSPITCFSYGAAVTEVEVDCLTGSHKVLKSDIVMDVGRSINPAIDIGQIEGAFVQGYGLFCMEQIQIDDRGVTLTTGPGSYKIPLVTDIPKQFNVSLLRDSFNKKAVFSSKAVGEPPLSLAVSVFCAIKSAVEAARIEAGIDGQFVLNSPCTAERIRQACPPLTFKSTH